MPDRHDDRIRQHSAVDAVERSLLLEADRAVVVDADAPLRLLAELRADYRIRDIHVAVADDKAAIHYRRLD